MNPNQALRIGTSLIAFSALAFAAPWVGSAMEALLPQVDLDQPYLSWLSPWLLYLAMPCVVLASFALVLGPGLLLALACGRARTAAQWLCNGFGVSLLVTGGATLALQLAVGVVRGEAYVAFLLVLQALALGWLWRRASRGELPPAPLSGPDRTSLVAFGGLALVGVVALTPKLFWEAMNDDGAQIYEIGRVLVHRPVPFLSSDFGPMSSYPGANMMLVGYPVSWFSRLFGEFPSAARIPFLLFLAVMQAAIVAFGESVRSNARRMCASEHALLALGVSCFALVMSYSATYDPYCADIALPATQDTLLNALFLIAAVAYLRADWIVWHFAVLACLLCSPNGVPMIAAWLFAQVLVTRDPGWPKLLRGAAALVVGVVTVAAIPPIMTALGLPAPGAEHSSDAIGNRLALLNPFDFRRVLMIVVPSGIFPFLALLGWRRADPAVCALLLVSAGLFALYYPLAALSLHYFAPSMALPLAAFFAIALQKREPVSRGAMLGCATLGSVALIACLPVGTAIYDGTRAIGSRIDVTQSSGYDSLQPYAYRAKDGIQALFPKTYDLAVPEQRWGGSPMAMRYYAERARGRGPKAYELADAEGHRPPPGRPVAQSRDAAVYVTDELQYSRDRQLSPRRSLGRDFLFFERAALFVETAPRLKTTLFVKPMLAKRPMLGRLALALAGLGALAAAFGVRWWTLRAHEHAST